MNDLLNYDSTISASSTRVPSSYITTADLKGETYYVRSLSYDDLMSQVNDSSLPIIDDETWNKVSEMLSSSDIELIKVGFELMSGYRFPRGIKNITIIHKAINNYLKNINY